MNSNEVEISMMEEKKKKKKKKNKKKKKKHCSTSISITINFYNCEDDYDVNYDYNCEEDTSFLFGRRNPNKKSIDYSHSNSSDGIYFR